jgi:hypothetical protein
VLAVSWLAVSCAGIRDPINDTSGPAVNKAVTANAMLADHLQLMQRLLQGSASDKAEAFASAQKEYDAAPTPSHELRLALVLATPEHPATDPVRAQKLLRELLANPETLVPGERALAVLELQQIDDYLTLQAENHRLAGEAARTADKLATLNHRLAAEAEEAPKLRKELEEARAKLDAIKNIERSLNAKERGTRRQNSSEGLPQ